MTDKRDIIERLKDHGFSADGFPAHVYEVSGDLMREAFAEIERLRADLAAVNRENRRLEEASMADRRRVQDFEAALCVTGGQIRAVRDADPVGAIVTERVTDVLDERDRLRTALIESTEVFRRVPVDIAISTDVNRQIAENAAALSPARG